MATKRKQKKSTKSTTTIVKKTARKRGKTMAKKKTRSRRRSSNGMTALNPILHGAIAGLVKDMVPFGMVGKIGVGVVAGGKAGMLGGVAKAIGTLGAAELTSGGSIMGINTPSLTSGAGDNW